MFYTTGYNGGFIHYSYQSGRESWSVDNQHRENVRAQYGQDVKYCKSGHAAKIWITKQRRAQADYWNTPYHLREQ